MWPPAKKPSEDTNVAEPQKFGWNTDHVHFQLSEFLPPKGTIYFQDYRIKLAKIVVREVNTVFSQREETYGHHALDLDGMDEGTGTVKRWDGDPNVITPSNEDPSPLVSDPLVNRSSAKLWNVRRGFKRIFKPVFQTQGAAKNGAAISTYWNRANRHAWIPTTTTGIQVPHQGVSISVRETDTPILTQYFLTIYVQFREFDLKTNNL